MKLLICVVIVFAIIMIGSLNKDLYKKCISEKIENCEMFNDDNLFNDNCFQDAKENCEVEYF